MKLSSIFVALAAATFFSHQGLAQTSAMIYAPAAPIAASAATPVPFLVPYAGIALTADGRPLTGTPSVTFLIYKEQKAGEPLWAETQAVQVDQGGQYTAHLGAGSSSGLPADLFATGEARWLEVEVAGEKAQPRVLLASVPYALKSADAATLGGLPASAFALAGTASAINAVSGTAGVGPDASSTVTTTGGASGYVPVFTGTSAIGESVLFQNSNGIGIKRTNPGAALDVGGKSIFRGGFELTRSANATSSAGTSSYPISIYAQGYNSSSKTTVNPFFELEAEPTSNNTSSPGAGLHLLYNSGSGNTAETGFYLNKDGTIHFATGQTFPAGGSGSGTITGVTAGTGLTGGGTSGNVTLKINTGTVPTLSGNNSFTGTETFTSSLNEDTDINIDNTNSNSGGVSPGIRFGNASGEGIASQRTSGGLNQYGLDLFTDYTSRMSITASGRVGIGTQGPYGQFEVDDSTGQQAISAYGSDKDNGGLAALFQGGDGTSGFGGGGIEVYSGRAGGGGSGAADAGYFGGDVYLTGTLSGGAKNFKIDHPLDPSHKYLSHSSIESSEMVNIYSGNATTDELGLATVQLPDWFEAENGDFRYQLTVMGERFAQAIVEKKINNHQFTIHTNASQVEVSWQVTGVRQDAYAKAHPLLVEETKPVREQGFYLHPELYGQPKEKQTQWAREPRVMQQLQQRRQLLGLKAQTNGTTPLASGLIVTTAAKQH